MAQIIPIRQELLFLEELPEISREKLERLILKLQKK